MKGWPSCLPVMVMVAGPGLLAGVSVCHESLFLVSVNAWPSMLAVSRMGAWVVVILVGLPGWSCPSRLHVNTLPCLSRAVILPPAAAACV